MKAEVAKREIESLDYYLQNHTNDYGEASHTAMMMAISALSENKGEWKPEDERLSLTESLLFRCSKCNIIFGHQTNFCPNCGCDMRGGE